MTVTRKNGAAVILGLVLLCSPAAVFASDAGAPVADAPVAIGGTVFSGYITDANTHVRLNVAVGNDVANIGGEVRTYVNFGGTDYQIGVAHIILAGEIGTKFNVPDIAIADILTAISQPSFPDGASFIFKKRVFEFGGTPLSMVALGTLNTVVLASHPAPSIDSVFVGGTGTDAHAYTFGTDSPSFDFALSGDDYLSTLSCVLDGKPAEDCISYAYATSTLADGQHNLVVTATDLFNQSRTDTVTFCINTCADVIAPTISVVADVFATSTSAGGMTVTYTTPTATDNVDPLVTVSCSPLSGTNFAIGNTTVTCNAQDAALNATSTSFVVHVTLNAPAPAPSAPVSNGPPVQNFSAPVIAPVMTSVSVPAPAPVVPPVEPVESSIPETVVPIQPVVREQPTPVKASVPKSATPETSIAPIAEAPVLQPAPETQSASAAESVTSNYLWILAGLFALAIAGIFVWNTYWTATK